MNKTTGWSPQLRSIRSDADLDQAVKEVLRTEFGAVWLTSAPQRSGKRTRTAVFAEAHSLQWWAAENLHRSFSSADLRQLIEPYVREPFVVYYYQEATTSVEQEELSRAKHDGLEVRVVSRYPGSGPYSEELIENDGLRILPVVHHVVVASGRAYLPVCNLLESAKRAGCETTLISGEQPKKRRHREALDHFVELASASKPLLERSPPKEISTKKPLDLTDRPRVVILPVRQDEEDAILSRVELLREGFEGKHGQYTLANIKRMAGNLKVAIKRIDEQGPGAAQDKVRNVIEDLDPDWVVLVGIGGAIPANEYTLGDILVATRVHDFTVGAYKESTESAIELSNRGGPMSRRSQDLISQIPTLQLLYPGWNTEDSIKMSRPPVHTDDRSLYYGSDDWKEDTRKKLALHFGKTSRERPLFWAAAIAGDGFLIKDTTVIEKWKLHARDLGAVEMELTGAYEAARRLNKEYPILCIRGISDVVGYKREHEWTKYACEAAGAFCVWLLSTMQDSYFARAKRKSSSRRR